MLELKHTFSFSQTSLIKPIHCKKSHRLLEFEVISKTNHRRQRQGFYQMSPYLVNTILHENNIKMENGQKMNIFSTLYLDIFEDSFLVTFSFPFFTPF